MRFRPAGRSAQPPWLCLKKVVLEGYELYVEGARNQENPHQFGKGTPDDWMDGNVYSRFPKTGILLFLPSCTSRVVRHLSIIMVALQLVSQPFFAAGIINGVGHAWGYRSYEMASTATNIFRGVSSSLVKSCTTIITRSRGRSLLTRSGSRHGWLFITVFSAVGLCKVSA